MSSVEIYSYFSYIGPLWLAALLGEAGHDRRLRFHINQGLMLFILELIFITVSLVVKKPVSSVPYVGPYLFYALAAVFVAISFLLSVKGMMNVSKGKQERLPVIGIIDIIR